MRSAEEILVKRFVFQVVKHVYRVTCLMLLCHKPSGLSYESTLLRDKLMYVQKNKKIKKITAHENSSCISSDLYIGKRHKKQKQIGLTSAV